jgi:plasmid stabilization system protein ParE
VARVEWSVVGARSLERLIRTHSLPPDTVERVRRSLRPLAQFPRLGPMLQTQGTELRFVVGPWRWMIVVYAYFPDEDRVVVVAVENGRSSTSATAGR